MNFLLKMLASKYGIKIAKDMYAKYQQKNNKPRHSGDNL